MKDLIYYQSLAQEMVRADRERDQMLIAMSDMWHNQWSLPSKVADLKWIHKVVSTDPHDALRAGMRVLSSVEPRIRVQPTAPNEKSRAKANEIERALGWHFKAASRRRRASVLRDVVLSALLYDEVIAQVVYLPEQIAALETFKGDTRRLQAAQRFGPFSIIVHNPRHVHVRYSDWMPEAVLMKRVVRVQEAVDFWGEKARKLKTYFRKKENSQYDHVTVYDYVDLDVRVVWALPQEGGGALRNPLGEASGSGGIQILREQHELNFLPWVARVGGTTLEDNPARQRIPLLYSVYTAGQWEIQNIIETLMTSEVIAYASAPRLKVEGPTDNVEVDYGEPGRPAYVPPGHALSAMQPPVLDQSLAAIADRIGARIGKSTVPRVLQTGDFPAGTAYATLNLATQSGLKSLTPYKELAEYALGDIFTQMLNWVNFTQEPVVAFGRARDDLGETHVLSPTDFDIQQVVVDVELTADVPVDRKSRIDASALAVRELGYSKERALEQIGEMDPQVIMQQAKEEELQDVDLEIEKQRRLALGQLETKQLLERKQQGILKGSQTKYRKQAADNGVLRGKIEGVINKLRGKQTKQLNGDRGVDGQEIGESPPTLAAPGLIGDKKDNGEQEV